MLNMSVRKVTTRLWGVKYLLCQHCEWRIFSEFLTVAMFLILTYRYMFHIGLVEMFVDMFVGNDCTQTSSSQGSKIVFGVYLKWTVRTDITYSGNIRHFFYFALYRVTKLRSAVGLSLLAVQQRFFTSTGALCGCLMFSFKTVCKWSGMAPI